MDRDYRLEFIPGVEEDAPNPPFIETYIRSEGRETRLDRSPAVSLKEASRCDERRHLTKRAIGVDLSAYQGKSVSFRWRLDATDSQLTGVIGDLKFIPKKIDSAARPPILIICSDAHRYDYALGEPGRRLMPRLQEFRKTAVTYSHAYSTASWTLPSIVSLFTGLNPRYHRTGIRTAEGEKSSFDGKRASPENFTVFTKDEYFSYSRYNQDLISLFEVLQEQGYAVRLISANPLYFLSGLCADGSDLSVYVNDNGEKINRVAFELINDLPKDQPAMLVAHYMDTHQYTVWKYQKRFPDKDYAEAGREELLAAYEEAVADADRHVAELLDQWNSVVGLDKSLVIFFADHGEHFREAVPAITFRGNEDRKIPGWDRPITHGNSMDDVLLHVPLLVHYPKNLGRAGGEENAPVSLLDVFPTILNILKLAPETDALGGHSLLSAEASDAKTERPFFADYQLTGADLASVRLGNFKLILNRSASKEALINLSKLSGVPSEVEAEEHDESRIQKLRAIYGGFALKAETATRDRKPNTVTAPGNQDQLIKGLKALGYFR